jgi:hypothetical protein
MTFAMNGLPMITKGPPPGLAFCAKSERIAQVGPENRGL